MPPQPTLLKAGSLLLEGGSLISQGIGIRDTLDANARVAGFNTAEQQALLPLNLEAIRADIQAVGDAADFRQRAITEEVRRSQRQRGLSDLSLENQIASTRVTREEVNTRSSINTDILSRTLAAITLSADERIRQLRLEQRDRTAEVQLKAAVSGVAVESGSVEAVADDIDEDFEARVGVTGEESTIRRAEATLRNTLELSTTTERLAVLDRTLSDLELESQQIEFLLEDSLFDAALQEEINNRNRDIDIDRLEREAEIVQRRAEVGIQQARAQEEFIEDEQDRALVGDILSAGSFGVKALTQFPKLAGNLGSLLGLTEAGSAGGAAVGGAAEGAAALFGSGSLNAVGSATGAASGASTGSAAAAAGAQGNLVSGATGASSTITGGGGSASLAGGGGGIGGSLPLSAARTAAQLGTAGQFASGVGATLGGTVVSGGFTSAVGTLGTVGGLGGSTTAFATAATTGAATGVTAATALGVIAPPVLAILGFAAAAGAFQGPGNTPAARRKAKDKVTEILTSDNPTASQLERAKALLGIPNNFEDPNPGTISNFGGVENFINDFGGIDALSPGAREVFQLALDKRTKERATREQAASARIGDNPLVADLRSQGFTAVQAEELLINQIGSGGE